MHDWIFLNLEWPKMPNACPLCFDYLASRGPNCFFIFGLFNILSTFPVLRYNRLPIIGNEEFYILECFVDKGA
jgi:hypothetical protein